MFDEDEEWWQHGVSRMLFCTSLSLQIKNLGVPNDTDLRPSFPGLTLMTEPISKFCTIPLMVADREVMIVSWLLLQKLNGPQIPSSVDSEL